MFKTILAGSLMSVIIGQTASAGKCDLSMSLFYSEANTDTTTKPSYFIQPTKNLGNWFVRDSIFEEKSLSGVKENIKDRLVNAAPADFRREAVSAVEAKGYRIVLNRQSQLKGLPFIPETIRLDQVITSELKKNVIDGIQVLVVMECAGNWRDSGCVVTYKSIKGQEENGQIVEKEVSSLRKMNVVNRDFELLKDRMVSSVIVKLMSEAPRCQ